MNNKYAIIIQPTLYTVHSTVKIDGATYTVKSKDYTPEPPSFISEETAEEDILNHLECILRDYRPHIFIEDMQSF